MDAHAEAPARPGVMTTLLMVIGVIPFIGLLVLIYHLLGIGAVYMGFLFLLYWMGMMHQSMPAFAPALTGSLGGIGMAWILLWLPVIAGPAAVYGGFALLAATLFCVIRGQATLLVNNAMMLYLTVGAIPALEVGANVADMVAALLVAAAYSFAFSQALNWLTARRQSGAQAPSPAVT
jgi:hypothetical protein